MRGVLIHLQAFINRPGHKQAGQKHQQTGMTLTRQRGNPRASVGRRSANNIQQGQGRR